MNFLTPEGFVHSLYQVLRLRPGAVWHWPRSAQAGFGWLLATKYTGSFSLEELSDFECALVLFQARTRIDNLWAFWTYPYFISKTVLGGLSEFSGTSQIWMCPSSFQAPWQHISIVCELSEHIHLLYLLGFLTSMKPLKFEFVVVSSPGTQTLRSRGTTKRSSSNPMGDPSVKSVAEGNQMVSRCALLLIIAFCRGLFFVLEQPRGSLLEVHPAMQKIFRKFQIYRKAIKMGNFGAGSDKPTWLYSGQSSKSRLVVQICLQRLDEFVDLNCTSILFEKGTIRICINQAVYWNARAVNIFMGPLADPCRTPGDWAHRWLCSTWASKHRSTGQFGGSLHWFRWSQ